MVRSELVQWVNTWLVCDVYTAANLECSWQKSKGRNLAMGPEKLTLNGAGPLVKRMSHCGVLDHAS